MHRSLSWLWKHRRLLLILLAIATTAVNAVAYMHAYRMTHFVEFGTRTAPPEKLSVVGKLGVLLTGVRFPRPTSSATPARTPLA